MFSNKFIKIYFLAILVGSLFLFLKLNLPTPIMIEGDGVGYFNWLHSVFFDRDLDFKNQLQHFSAYDRGSQWFLTKNILTSVGRVPNPYAFGMAILWLPFLLVAHFFTYFVNLFCLKLTADGYSIIYVWLINFSALVFGFLALIINFFNLKKFFSAKIGFIALMALWLATPWFYYQFFEPSMSHVASLLLVSLFFYLFNLHFFENKKHYCLLAVIVFLMVAVRWQNLLFLIVFLPLIKKIDWKSVVGISIAVFSWLTLQMSLWRLVYGSYLLVPQGKRFVRLELHGFYTLFSSDHGLILWSPILIFAFVGLIYFWRENRKIAVVVGLAFLAQWLLNSSLNDLGGGDAFGGRRFIETLPFLVLGLAAIIKKFSNFLSISIFILVLLVMWNFLLLDNYRLNLIPRAGTFEFFQTDFLRPIKN